MPQPTVIDAGSAPSSAQSAEGANLAFPERWKIWRSDTGRFYATRTERWSRAQEAAGCSRTLHADTHAELLRLIAEQDQLADKVAA